MILSKDLSNISHMFQDCAKLEQFLIYDDYIMVNEYDDDDFKNSENISHDDIIDDMIDDINDNFYSNVKNDNIYSNCSEIKENKNKS